MGARDKFTLAAQAVRDGIGRLAPTDRFSVVVYDEQVDVVAPGRPAAADARADALRALGQVEPRGSTDLGGGWLRGAEQVASELDPEAVNRVLLLTDGLANVGITRPAELNHHAGELRARGISTSTFGVGLDFDEGLLAGMADAGGGAFRFIGTPGEIPALIGREVGELLEVTARGVELRIAGPEGLRVECLSPFPVEATSQTSIVHLGDLVADQVVRLVLAVGFPLGEVGREIGAELSLADRDGRLAGSATLTWTFAPGHANDGQERDREVDRAVAQAHADRARREAVELNRRGAWDEARSALRGGSGGPAPMRGLTPSCAGSSRSSSARRTRGPWRGPRWTARSPTRGARSPSSPAAPTARCSAASAEGRERPRASPGRGAGGRVTAEVARAAARVGAEVMGMFDLDDILDPASPEGTALLAASGFLDDDRPCGCWCGCGRPAEWPDDECAACLEGRHPDPRDPEGRR